MWVKLLLWADTWADSDRAHLHMRMGVSDTGLEHQREGRAEGAGKIGRKIVHNMLYMRDRGGVLPRSPTKVPIGKSTLPNQTKDMPSKYDGLQVWTDEAVKDSGITIQSRYRSGHGTKVHPVMDSRIPVATEATNLIFPGKRGRIDLSSRQQGRFNGAQGQVPRC